MARAPTQKFFVRQHDLTDYSSNLRAVAESEPDEIYSLTGKGAEMKKRNNARPDLISLATIVEPGSRDVYLW